MTIYDKFTKSSLESLADWIDDFGQHDDSPWMNWFNRNYCEKCESEIVTAEESQAKLGFQLFYISSTECSYCEVYKHCRFFPNEKETPDNKKIIEMWLQQEVEESKS